MTTRLALLVLLSTVVLLPTARGADEPAAVPSGFYTTLSRAVRDLAKAGHADEAKELLEILGELGLPEKRAATVRKQLEREKPRKAKPAPRVAKSIRKAVDMLAALLSTPPEAIDSWMGTFYHRLPLLDPGLLAIGWGFDDDIAVLDSGSLLMLTGEEETRVAWPVANATNVPLRFNPELPHGKSLTRSPGNPTDEPVLSDRVLAQLRTNCPDSV